MASSDPHQRVGELIQQLLGECEEFEMKYRTPPDESEKVARIECSLNLAIENETQSGETGEDEAVPVVISESPVSNGDSDDTEAPDRDMDTSQSSAGSSRESDEEDGVVQCPYRSCGREFESRHGLRIHYSKVHQGSDATDRSKPADVALYKDPAVLREIYDEDASFAEMTKKLDVDVSPSTVRRHMINFGIHNPSRYDTSEDEATTGTEANPTLSNSYDGREETDEGFEALLNQLGINRSIALDDLKEAVRESETLYETSKRLEMDQDQTKELLVKMDLLDAVFGRLQNKERREVSSDEIDERIENIVLNRAT